MCHLIFDVNMDLSIKACMVGNRAMTEAPSILTYSSVISRYRVFFTY